VPDKTYSATLAARGFLSRNSRTPRKTMAECAGPTWVALLLAIAWITDHDGEETIANIGRHAGMSRSSAGHHLAIMARSTWVERRMVGRKLYYVLDPISVWN
jgi:hypothetical protein